MIFNEMYSHCHKTLVLEGGIWQEAFLCLDLDETWLGLSTILCEHSENTCGSCLGFQVESMTKMHPVYPEYLQTKFEGFIKHPPL